MYCEANKVVLFGLRYLVSQKKMFWYSNKFYSEDFKKTIVGAYGKKNLVYSIYIFDVKPQASYCFILW